MGIRRRHNLYKIWKNDTGKGRHYFRIEAVSTNSKNYSFLKIYFKNSYMYFWASFSLLAEHSAMAGPSSMTECTGLVVQSFGWPGSISLLQGSWKLSGNIWWWGWSAPWVYSAATSAEERRRRSVWRDSVGGAESTLTSFLAITCVPRYHPASASDHHLCDSVSGQGYILF